jgi:hypothetical protein
MHTFAQSRSGAGQCRERQAGIAVIQQPIQRSAAGVHALRHSGFGQALSLHLFFDLQCQHFLERGSGSGFKDAFFFQEVIELASNRHDEGLSLKINPLFSELNILRRRGLRFLDEAMKQHHVRSFDNDQYAGKCLCAPRVYKPYHI